MANSAWSDPGVVWGSQSCLQWEGEHGTHPKDPGHSALCIGLLGWEAAPPTTEPSSAAVCVCTDACQLHAWWSRVNKPYYTASPLHLNLRPNVKVPSHFYFRLKVMIED